MTLVGENTQQAAVTGRRILALILTDYRGPVAIRLWDGELAIGHDNAPCTVVFHQPSILRNLILHRNVAHLAEAYLAGKGDIEGDTEVLFDLMCYMRDLVLPWSVKWRIMRLALHLPGVLRHAGKEAKAVRAGHDEHHNTRKSIAHHYDVSNDFYRLWLDREMVRTSWIISAKNCGWRRTRRCWTSVVAGAPWSVGPHDTMGCGLTALP